MHDPIIRGGKLVDGTTPGFVDMHTHNDAQATGPLTQQDELFGIGRFLRGAQAASA